MKGVNQPLEQRPDCALSCMAGPYYDGELTPEESRRFLEHLFFCPVCRMEVRAIRRLSELIHSDGRPGPWTPGPEDECEAAAEWGAGHEMGLPSPAGAEGRRRPRLKPRPGTTPAVGLAGGGRGVRG
ncbi:MAG: zf-HC2 domain-containing protein [Bacillota bacterium]|nr:MAG: zf-HC2 domain-containing protein [Bacillota bacterium]